MPKQKLWYILTPKKKIYQDAYGECHAEFTKAKTIESLCWMMAHGGISIDDVWSDWQQLGYTCERLDVEVPGK